MELIRPTTFSASGIRERQDLQAVLRDNAEAIAPGLMVVSEEFSNWEDSASRIDLLCLDKDANLVVVELKRDDSRTMDVQAVRYAAMISAMDFDDVVSAHADYMTRRGRNGADSPRILREFLGAAEDEDVVISTKPRIILLASSYSKEVTTTVMWLNERDLNITCIQCRVYDIAGKTFLDLEQVIPLPSASDYQVRLRDKAIRTERVETARKRNKRTVERLVDAGILTPGTRLRLIKEFKGVEVTDQSARFITFTGSEGRQLFKWDYNNQQYPNLTAVCIAICQEWGTVIDGRVDSLPESGFDSATYWAIDRASSIDGRVDSLYDLAKRLTDGDTTIADNTRG